MKVSWSFKKNHPEAITTTTKKKNIVTDDRTATLLNCPSVQSPTD